MEDELACSTLLLPGMARFLAICWPMADGTGVAGALPLSDKSIVFSVHLMDDGNLAAAARINPAVE